jgi:hypothetical protein
MCSLENKSDQIRNPNPSHIWNLSLIPEFDKALARCRHRAPYPLNYKPLILNPQPSTLNPLRSTLKAGG